MEDIQNRDFQNAPEEQVNIKDILALCLSKWYWFVISVVICVGIAAIKIMRTAPTFTRSTTVMIKENNTRRTSSNELEALMSGTMMSTISSKVANEIVTFESNSLMKEVVKRLHLDTECQVDGRFHKNVIYGSQVPYSISFEDQNIPASFVISKGKDDMLEISGMQYSANGETVKESGTVKFTPGDTLHTAIGAIVIDKSEVYAGDFSKPVYVSHRSVKSATDSYLRRLSVGAVDTKNNADIIKISFQDLSTARAEDVLNTLVAVYNENWVEDRNRISVSTTMFINDRLETIEKDLGNVDNNISSFKSKNLIPDIAAASTMYMAQSQEIDAQIQQLDNQLYMAKYVRNYLTNSVSKDELIPASSSTLSGEIAGQIRSYNETLLKRNNLVANSSEKNPIVIDLDETLQAMRYTIIASIDNEINSIDAQISQLQKTGRKTNSSIAENPTQAKYLLTVERRQKVMESLYLYLLQKREENELSQAFTAYNTRVIDPPTGSSAPVAPNKKQILLIAFLLGLMLPAAYIYIMELLNTKVRGKSDLKKLTCPVIGEIPNKTFKKGENADVMVVKQGNRDMINEAFRVLRANMEFMSKGNEHNVIAVTSYNIGSGKSFISANLGASLAIKGLKVLIIDGDLRHASSSELVNSPAKGLSDYLAEKEDDINSLIIEHDKQKNLFVLPVGTIPPNPTELVSSDRFTAAIESLKSQYAYIFVDCPPAEIMADAQLIIERCDRTLFVMRAGLFDRSMLPELEKAYTSNKYKTMSVILNGTEMTGAYAYGKGYGKGYGKPYGKTYYYGKKSEDVAY